MKVKVGILLVFLSVFELFAQGEVAVPFVLISPNARAGAMGESGVAMPYSPSTAMHFNVAGLGYIEDHGNEYGVKSELPGDFSYASWLPKLKLDDLWYGYFAGKMAVEDLGVFGASFRYLNYGTVVWTGENQEQLGTYDAKEYEIALAYSTNLSEKSYLGVAAKFIHSGIVESGLKIKVGTETSDAASTMALDLGYYHLLGDLAPFLLDSRLGLSWNNIGPDISYIDNAQADPLPTYGRIGFSSKIMETEFSQLTFSYDWGLVTQSKTLKGQSLKEIMGRVTHAFGTEFMYDKTFSMRGGYFHENEHYGGRQFFTVGGGFNLEFIVIDFSYLISSGKEEHPLDGTTRFSFSFLM